MSHTSRLWYSCLAPAFPLLLLLPNAASAITLVQEFKGEVTPPSVPGLWNYGPDFYVLPNGNVAMILDIAHHWGSCSNGTNTIDFTSDTIRVSERIGSVYQTADTVICPSNFQDYSCPPGPCADTPRSGGDVFHDADPAVAYYNGMYRLFYTGATAPGPTFGGAQAAVFYAYSLDGRTFTKYADPLSGQPVPVVATIPDPLAWGTGQPTVIVDTVDGQQILVMYYSYWPTDCVGGSELRRAISTDGITWTNHRAVLPGCVGGGEQNNFAAAVRKMTLGGSSFYFMVSQAAPDAIGNWNWSLDGIHWQPWTTLRRIDSGGYTSQNPGLSVPDGTSTIYTAYGSSVPSQWEQLGTWRIRYTKLTLETELSYGSFDEVTGAVARGWIYDPDRGYNDQNGDNRSGSGAAGVGAEFKFVIDGTIDTPVLHAEAYRPDLVATSVAPDPYHGVRLDLAPYVSSGVHTAVLMTREWPENNFRQIGLSRSFTSTGPGTRFHPLNPCRLLDTRNPVGPYGGPALRNREARNVWALGQCGIPDDAIALVANFTGVAPPSDGFVPSYPTGLSSVPNVSAISLQQGKSRANNTIVNLTSGAFSLYCVLYGGGSSHFVVDVSGYLARP